MPRPPFPKTLRQFQSDFATEEACKLYLTACRWPDGFSCPRCGHGKAYTLVGLGRQQCGKCRYQVSLTSGTILHRTKIPLTHWFWAAYLMTIDKRGVSALLLQRQLGLTCYETAWMMLHKLRRAMVNAAREPLHGEVEVDDTWIGGEQAGTAGKPSAQGQACGSGHGRHRETGSSLRPNSHEDNSGFQVGHDKVLPLSERPLLVPRSIRMG